MVLNLQHFDITQFLLKEFLDNSKITVVNIANYTQNTKKITDTNHRLWSYPLAHGT